MRIFKEKLVDCKEECPENDGFKCGIIVKHNTHMHVSTEVNPVIKANGVMVESTHTWYMLYYIEEKSK